MSLTILTNTRLAPQRRCPRQHWYRYELGLQRIRSGDARRLGANFHLGLQRGNEGQSAEQAIETAVASYSEVPQWANHDDWAVERETVRALLAGHFWRYENDGYEILHAEVTWEMPLVNPATGYPSMTYVLQGKIDGIVRLPDGRIAVLEYKTAGEDIGDDATYWKRLRADPQIGLYVLAARHGAQVMPDGTRKPLGLDVATVIYDVTRKPTIRPKQIPLLDEEGCKVVLDSNEQRVMTKQGKPRQTGDTELGYVLQARTETADEYAQRVIDNIGERPDQYFARREVPRLESDLQELKEELWQQAAALTESRKAGRWFRNGGKLTCDYCDYADICLQGIQVDPTPAGFERLEDMNPELGAE